MKRTFASLAAVAVVAVGAASAASAAPGASVTGRPLALKAQRLASKPASLMMLAERWDGARWRIEPTPHPTGSSANFLNGVTCTSRRECIAVGSTVAGKITVPLVERWNGSRWSIVKTPRPRKAVSGNLAGVSCPTSRECMAVGEEINSSHVISAFAERWNGSRRTLAGEFRPATNAALESVSCPSARLCTAVGVSQTKKATFTLAERWTAGRWRRQATPGTGGLFGVSCPAFSDCTAVGTQPNGQIGQEAVLVMQWNGRRWRTQSAPEPLGATAGILLGVSCPTATPCEAAGWALLTTAVTVADNWNGKKWTLEPTPSLTGTRQHTFAAVWCGAHVACRAAGSVDMVSGDFQTLVERR